MGATSRIFCFVNGGKGTDWQQVVAVAEDGTPLAAHVSSTHTFARHDIGITSEWKHETYRAHYPDGFDLVWSDDPEREEWYAELLAKATAHAACAKGGA